MATLLRSLRALFALSLYVINTIFWATPIFIFGLIKLIPITPVRDFCTLIVDTCAANWVSVNTAIQKLSHNYQLVIDGDLNLSPKQWYMIIANHQSWVDILVLQRALNRRAPFLKFFLKRELIYVPVLGIAWWALDFPFMQRYSAQTLRKKPHLKGKDLETTKRSCAKFKSKPVSVMNFVEGTRFTETKFDSQKPPFTNLLRPKAGGLAFALEAMGDQIDTLLDISIYYPNGRPSFWDFLSGNLGKVVVHIKRISIDESMRGDYANNKTFKNEFQAQLTDLWQQKDKQLDLMKGEHL
ncbi:acyltransferase [Paraferrimonas sp. SM1919]|uniref:acyltransferase n=1 Tax=Paraferrimonas sp. SM1919 TaxID=2662263 RepID=UPI0013D8D81C|nr:acyltransferase [Paraferrimonas sp. SM1919]